MIISRIALIGLVAAATLSLCWGAAVAQQGVQVSGSRKSFVPRAATVGETLQSINDDYNRMLLQIEKQRLERLGQLAATPDAQGRRRDLRDAVPPGDRQQPVRRGGAGRPTDLEDPRAACLRSVRFLAQTIKIIAAADRGAYDESLADLRKHIGPGSEPDQKAEASSALLDTPSMLAILGAYYQRLVQGGRFDVARKAFQLIHDETSNPALKEFCAGRLNQLNMVGKAAPPIQGTDLDGKPVNLADLKGNVVLVVFWASWCIPNAAEIAWLDQLYETYRNRGFRIVGINLDTLQSGDPKLEMVMPNIRRFLMDHNVRWPNLINGEGVARLRQGLWRHRDPEQRPDRPRRHGHPRQPVAEEPRPGHRAEPSRSRSAVAIRPDCVDFDRHRAIARTESGRQEDGGDPGSRRRPLRPEDSPPVPGSHRASAGIRGSYRRPAASHGSGRTARRAARSRAVSGGHPSRSRGMRRHSSSPRPERLGSPGRRASASPSTCRPSAHRQARRVDSVR